MEEEQSEEKIVDVDKQSFPTDKQSFPTDKQSFPTDKQSFPTDRIYDLLNFYKLPLILIFLSIFLIGAGILSWQSSQKTAKITFSGDEEDNVLASQSAKIKADIEGAVVRPGVYQLDFGSRISDLLILAGGLAGEADREWVAKNLNLAGKVADGGKIYIPNINNANATNNTNTTNKQININSATLSELETLPGVGPVIAQKIIDGRPYQTIEELVQRKIVGQSVFEKIKGQIGL